MPLSDPALVDLGIRASAVLARVGFIIFFLPIIGEPFTPARVRVLIALGLSAVALPLVPPGAVAAPSSLGGLLIALVPEFLLGLLMGLTVRLVFAAVQFAGQLVGEQIGFGLAGVIDPANQTQITITAQLYYLFSVLFFLAIDGHHLLIRAMMRSFEVVPLFTLSMSDSLFEFFNGQVLEMFTLALVIAAPVIAAMLLTELAMGLISRAVPQVNILIESFSLRIGLGLLVMGLTFGGIGVLLANRFSHLDEDLERLLQLLG